ncbi:MAG: hypothetical protein OXC98_02675 [bacterium]|nr:hypothetical protein [Acidimicrobiia bacterium]MCY4649260.1 hypothetical protein [bacterium]
MYEDSGQPVYEWNGRRYVYDSTRREELRDIPTIIKANRWRDSRFWVEYGEQGEADLTAFGDGIRGSNLFHCYEPCPSCATNGLTLSVLEIAHK